MKRLVTLLVGIALTVGMMAQTDSTSYSLSLAQAKEYAAEHNRTLQNSSYDVRQAYAQRWQSIATMLPQASMELNYLSMCNYQMDFSGMSINMPDYGTLGVTVSVAINGQTVMACILNNIAIKMQEITKDQSAQNVNSQVTQIYAGILVMDEVKDLLERSMQNVETLHKMTAKAVEVGTTEQTTADQIEVRINTLENSIKQTERNVNLYYNSLKLQLGIEPTANVTLTTKLDEIINDGQILALQGTDFDMERNYNWQLTEQNTELARKQIVLAAMQYVPTLSAYYSYSGRKDFGDGGFNMTPPNAIGVTLSVPLWTSGKTAAAITEKKLAYLEALNTQDQTRDQLLLQDQQLRFNLVNAYETYVIDKKSLDVTERVMQSTSNKFTYGVASSQELVTASNDLITAQNTYAQAALTLIQAQTELEIFLNK